MKYSGIGGQAVIEGIMMKNKSDYATAVRKPDGEIEIQKEQYVSMTEKVKFCSLPFTWEKIKSKYQSVFTCILYISVKVTTVIVMHIHTYYISIHINTHLIIF